MSGHVNFEKIYLFEIGRGLNGFAKFTRVYERKSLVAHTEAKDEVMASRLNQNWTRAIGGKYTAGGLNMRFSAKEKALVFVRLPENEPFTVTEFGSKIAVDLDVAGSAQNNIVRECQRFANTERMHLVCSFALDVPAALARIDQTTDGNRIGRLPIMFDFVDKNDGISPVFKGRHQHSIHIPVFGHGGIHPRGGSSMIILEQAQDP
jgi:hypothetical protein